MNKTYCDKCSSEIKKTIKTIDIEVAEDDKEYDDDSIDLCPKCYQELWKVLKDFNIKLLE